MTETRNSDPSGVHPAPTLGADFGAEAPVRELAEVLLPLYYQEVRRLARRERWRVGAGGTLVTTALIHEAFLRLRNHPGFADRTHFLRASALAMRHALTNHAATHAATKRGGPGRTLSLEEVGDPAAEGETDLIALNEALERLGHLEPHLSQVVECRYFAGYTEEETAELLGLSRRTVTRYWVRARAWLLRELSGSG